MTENYRHDTMQKLGLGYEDLRKDNPGLIYCAISGFGRTGPYAERGGFDLIAQGMSGLMSFTGEGPGRPPWSRSVPRSPISPPASWLRTGDVGRLHPSSLKTGEGQRVDTSLFEAGIAHTYWQSRHCALPPASPPAPWGRRTPSTPPIRRSRPSRWVDHGRRRKPTQLGTSAGSNGSARDRRRSAL